MAAFSGLDQRVLDTIKKSPDDHIPFRARTKHVHATWARTFSSLPELFIQPQSVKEIQKVVNLARRCRRRITTTGSSHSPSDLTCTSSWLINLDHFDEILDIDLEAKTVRMQAGIRLYELSERLDQVGLAMPNLGSINEQSIAGVISTGTHGSTLSQGLISDSIIELKITTADGVNRTCSRTSNNDLFRGALLSLGALGIITEVTFQAVPAFSLKWSQVIDTDHRIFTSWESNLWKQGDFVRLWWFPYMRKSVIWAASKTDEPHRDPPKSWYDGRIGYLVYHNLLYLSRFVPSILPTVEWFVFGMQYGFRNGSTISGVQPSRKALLMNCLYSQYVNEWAIPLSKGPEALKRLSSWLNDLRPGDRDYLPHGIPFTNKGLYVHSPVEVRVTDTTRTPEQQRPWLDPTSKTEPTLYLNAIMYRPYGTEPPCKDEFYDGFEYLMKELGGKPHWAKNFGVSKAEVEAMYAADSEDGDLAAWRKVRDQNDPRGMFAGSWHRATVLEGEKILPLEEQEEQRTLQSGKGYLYTGAPILAAS